MSRRGSRTGEGKREAAAASGFVAPGTRVRRPEPASDLSRGLRAAAARSLGPEALDSLLVEALDALATLVPYELATLMELDGETLRVRVARGPLAAPEVLRHRLPLASFPSLRAVLAGGRAHAFEEHDHAEGDGDPFDGVLDFPHGHACMVVPLSSRDETLGLITLDQRRCDPYPPDLVRLADVFGKLVALVLRHGEQSELLRNLVEIMEEQNRALLQRVHGRLEPGVALESCRSLAMRELARLARQVAASEAPVLIQGETGTGKELLARAIHAWSPRAGRPLVTLNCAALPENLIESELFGHVKGAFTGATTSRLGRFQAADGGTLFLDEVGELPLGLQAKLLRVLQEGAFEPLGSDRTVRVDVRILAATNRDLPAAVRDRQFREDLFYRLAVFPLTIPPLRARPEDVAPLAQGILARLPARPGAAAWSLSDPALAWLESQPWPGNVRELVNALERATILARTSQLSVGDVGGSGSPASAPVPSSGPQDAGEAAHPAGAAIVTMEEMERRHIEAALTATGGRIYGADGAARLLGLPGSTLASRMKKLGLAGARSRRKARPGL